MDGELRSARATENAQCLSLLEERRQWEEERMRMQEERTRLAVLAAELLVAVEGSDVRSRGCATQTAAALEETLRAAAVHLAETRRGFELEQEKLRLQVTELYERLGQARARLLAEAARHKEMREAERAAEHAVQAALRDEAASATAAALCSRAFRAVERAAAVTDAADAAAVLAAAQDHVAQHTARAICSHVMRRVEAHDAKAAAMDMALRQAQAEKLHADALAALAAARLADQASAAAGAQAMVAQLAESQHARDELSIRLAEVQQRLEHEEAVREILTVQLNEALAANAGAVAAAEAAQGRLEAVETAVAQLQAKLATVKQERRESGEALQNQLTELLAAQVVSEEKLASALCELEALRQQLNAARSERQHLEGDLVAAQRAMTELSDQLTKVKASSVELQVQVEVSREEREGLTMQLAEAQAASAELQGRIAAADAFSSNLLVQMTAARDAMLLQQQQQHLAAELEREQWTSELALVQSARQASESECALLEAKVRGLCAELEVAQAELQKTLSDLEHEQAQHVPVKLYIESQQAAPASPQDQLRLDLVCAKTAGVPVAVDTGTSTSADCRWTRVAGPLSHRLNLDGTAECGAEAAEGAAYAASGSAQQMRADGGSDDAVLAAGTSTEGCTSGIVHASLSRCSTDQPQYDQRHSYSEPDGPTRCVTEAISVTNVIPAPITALPQPESSLFLLPERVVGSREEQKGECSLVAQDSPRRRHSSSLAPVTEAGTQDLGAGLDGEAVLSKRELDLCLRLSMLRDMLEAEREANAARIVTLRALWSAERNELQRQLEALAAVAATSPCDRAGCCVRANDNPAALLQACLQETNPEQLLKQRSISGTWELPPCTALVQKSSAPTIGDVNGGASVVMAGDQAGRRVSEPQRQRAGLPPLPPCVHDAQQHSHHRPYLERSSSQNSDSSTGSSSYWLPAAAVVAAAAADYDLYHEPIWMANAAFGSAVSLGCPSAATSAAPSETQVMDLAETIATLRAELAASQDALRKERSTVKPGSRAEPTSRGSGAEAMLGRNVDGCCRTALMAGPVPKSEGSALLPSASMVKVAVLPGPQTHGSESDPISELVHALEMERTEHAVRQLVLRALCAVERRALQRELADAYAARAIAEADANEVRGRLSALLMAHERVCGEVEVLRAARDELEAELVPSKRALERLRTHNEQLRMEASEAAIQRAADADKAAAVAVDAVARIAASETREEVVMAARCAALAARCEDPEVQLHVAGTVSPQLGAASEAEMGLGLVESSTSQLAAQVLELRSELASSASALERLRMDYASARQDRQWLQQQLASLLVQTAVAQDAAAELCSSLHAASSDLDARRETALAQAKSAAARQQLARASVDGWQRAVETQAWERQALVLQEQLAQIVRAARTDLSLLATAMGGSVMTSPQEATDGSVAFSPTAALPLELAAGTLRSSLSEVTATNALLQGAGWAGMGRRCFSDMDVSSLAKRAGKAAATVRLLAAQQQQHQSPGRDGIFALSAGLSPLRQRDAGDGNFGRVPFLSGLAPIAVHHFALLQGRDAWNPCTADCLGTKMEQICCRQRWGSACAEGARSTTTATVTAATPRLADGAAVGVEAAAVPSSYQTQPQPRRQVLRLHGYQQQFGLASNPDVPTPSEMAYSPVTSPSSTGCLEPCRRSQSAGGMLTIFAGPKPSSTAPLLRLEEEVEEEGDQEQEAQDQMEREREGWLPEGYEVPEAGEGAGQEDEGLPYSGYHAVLEDITRGPGVSLGRVASETDMHLFYNPMFATFQETAGGGAGAGRRCLQVLPASARMASDDASYVTDLQAALAGACPTGDCTLPAAAGQAYPSRPQALNSRRGAGAVFARMRRLSADHRAGESTRALLLQRIPVWQMPSSRTQPVSLAGTPPSGPDLISAYSAGGADGGERLVPVSRSNPVVKLYKKISKRLSNTSRENREGL
ncbi:hypothetical protein Vretifemale_309 [Volvox reticuliferus]|nr:hypothetical protein Vretifemale_309 [Volvox reticuliferus]